MLYITWRKYNELVKSVEGADDNALECPQVKAQGHVKKSGGVSDPTRGWLERVR